MTRRSFLIEESLSQLTPNDPQAAELLLQAFAIPIADLAHSSTGWGHDRLEDFLADLFASALANYKDFKKSEAPTLSAWMYAACVKELMASVHRPRKAHIIRILPDILQSEPHYLEPLEIAYILQIREVQPTVQSVRPAPSIDLMVRYQDDFPGLTEQVHARLKSKFRRKNILVRPFKGLKETALLIVGGVFFLIVFLLTNTDNLRLPAGASDRAGDLFLPSLRSVTNPVSIFIHPHDAVSDDGPTIFNTDPVLSANGSSLVFASNSSSLVGDDENRRMDIFLFSTSSGIIERISVTSEGLESRGHSFAPAISGDGNRIVFATNATNLGDIPPNACGPDAGGDHCARIYFHDRLTGETRLISTWEDGSIIRRHTILPAISNDGRTVAFWMYAGGMPDGGCPGTQTPAACADLVIKDLEKNETVVVPVGKQDFSVESRLDFGGGGRLIAFTMQNQDTFFSRINSPNEYEAVVYDRFADHLYTLNLTPDGEFGKGNSYLPSIASGSLKAAFVSAAGDLVPGDSNHQNDVFVRDLSNFTTVLVSADEYGRAGDGPSGAASTPNWPQRIHLSESGRYVAFNTSAVNLLPDGFSTWCGTETANDWNCLGLIFYDLVTGEAWQLPVRALSSFQKPNFYTFPTVSDDGNFMSIMNAVRQGGGLLCPIEGCASVWLYDHQTRTARLANSPLVAPEAKVDWIYKALIRGHESWVRDASLFPDGRTLATGGQDGKVLVHNLEDLTILKTLDTDSGAVLSVDVSPDGTFLAAGSHAGQLSIWDIQTGDKLVSFEDQPGSIQVVVFSPTGERLASGSSEGVWLWDIHAGNIILRFDIPLEDVNALAFSPDGRFLAAAAGKEVRILRVNDGLVVTRLGGHEKQVLDLTFSPDGEFLVTASSDGKAIIWHVMADIDLLLTEYVSTLVHNDWVQSLAFSPDSTVLATGDINSSIYLWSFPELKLIKRLHRGSQRQVLALEYSPDGKLLLATTIRGVRVWSHEIFYTPSSSNEGVQSAP